MAARGRLVVNGLRVLWVVVVLWYEVGIFIHSTRACHWPDASFIASDASPYHLLLIADPQILDHRSYPSRSSLATYISRFLVDLNLRKNWQAAMHTEPDAVVFLGDMMDSGRFDMSDEEYEVYYSRFKSIFKLNSDIPQLFIPGNHDTGLGESPRFSPEARSRYIAHFGELNNAVSIANHTLVLLDAPNLVDEDYRLGGASAKYNEWDPIPGGTLEFVKDFSSERQTQEKANPVVLFTHIPLYRGDGAACGPLRERGTIRPGVGFGYQNTLGKLSTKFLIDTIQPSIIFSGDDHDYCEYIHKVDSPRNEPVRLVREVSVKSLSMAMGIRRPGFQLLSLAPEVLRPNSSVSLADAPCMLPDQLGIYLTIYIPLVVISLFVVVLYNFLRASRPRVHNRNARRPAEATAAPRRLAIRLDLDLESDAHNDDEYDKAEDVEDPATPSKYRDSAPSQGAVGDVARELGQWMRYCYRRKLTGKRDNQLFVKACLRDIRDIAVFPVGLLVITAWWTIRY